MAYKSSDGRGFTNAPMARAHDARMKMQADHSTTSADDENAAQSVHIAKVNGKYHVQSGMGHSDQFDSLDDAFDHARGHLEPGYDNDVPAPMSEAHEEIENAGGR